MNPEPIEAAHERQSKADALREQLKATLSPEDQHKLAIIEECAVKMIMAKIPFWLFAETTNLQGKPDYMQFNWCPGNEKVEMSDDDRQALLADHWGSLAWNSFSSIATNTRDADGNPPENFQDAMDVFVARMVHHQDKTLTK